MALTWLASSKKVLIFRVPVKDIRRSALDPQAGMRDHMEMVSGYTATSHLGGVSTIGQRIHSAHIAIYSAFATMVSGYTATSHLGGVSTIGQRIHSVHTAIYSTFATMVSGYTATS